MHLKFGQRFGSWRVVGPAKDQRYRVWVLCDCGTVTTVQMHALVNHNTIWCVDCGRIAGAIERKRRSAEKRRNRT